MAADLVLITGGGGFLGRAIAARCLARGWRVRRPWLPTVTATWTRPK